MRATGLRSFKDEENTMQRSKHAIWISASVLIAGAIATSLAPRAIAQARAALVRDLDSSVRGTRFDATLRIAFGSSPTRVGNFSPTIPVGKKYVVQSVSVQWHLTDGQNPMETRVTFRSSPHEQVNVFVDMDLQGVNSRERQFTGNRDIDRVLLPGEVIDVALTRTDDLGDIAENFADVTILGYLVDSNP
jgi:hypothetical protein